MTVEDRINLLDALGKYLMQEEDSLQTVIRKAHHDNVWFTPGLVMVSIRNICNEFLQKEKLTDWIKNYPISDTKIKQVGIIAAGNIPLVALHDILAVFVVGHKAKIKLSQKDEVLVTYIVNQIVALDPRAHVYFEIVERIKDIDAIIATGSDNSSRYFHYYFDKYPHIIRKNRVGVAVLYGHESDDELLALGQDVFQYYGLGCRNVSALRIPSDFNLVRLLKLWEQFSWVRENHAYNNNFDYNLAIYIMNKVHYLSNDVIILKEDNTLASRLATLNYKYYQSLEEVTAELIESKEQIQVVVSKQSIPGIPTLLPGQAQCPTLTDYADGIDTLAFLSTL